MAKITVFNFQKAIPISKRTVQKMVRSFLEKKKVLCGEVIIHFVSKKKISSLHKTHFGDPSPTDCISFPIDNPADASKGSILGEVFVCPEVALEYAKKHLIDPKLELDLYIIHGLLHLLGYDDIDPKERRKMRREEKKWLSTKTKV